MNSSYEQTTVSASPHSTEIVHNSTTLHIIIQYFKTVLSVTWCTNSNLLQTPHLSFAVLQFSLSSC
jgi:hypothetical protein